MHLLDLTLSSPAENLALDEALLDAAEAGELDGDVLRLWEMPRVAIILGRSSRAYDEVDLEAAEGADAPVLRRASGGAAVVVGPGCLVYSVVLRYEGREHLRMIDEAHQHVLGIVRSAIEPLVAGVKHSGICDLTVGGRKFCGNSLRCKRDHLLYHGTLLHDFDLALVARLLKMPPRQPDYRGGRPHAEFVTNLPVSTAALRASLSKAFSAQQALVDWPQGRTHHLVKNRYSQSVWNLGR
jgi:lipoate-protein ligase A